MSRILELLTPILTTSLTDVADRIGEKAEDKVRDFASQLFVYQVITSVVATIFALSCFSGIALAWIKYFDAGVGSSLWTALFVTSLGFGIVSLGILAFAIKKLKPEPPRRSQGPNTLIVIAEAVQTLATALIDDRKLAAEATAQKQRVDDLEATTRKISEALAILVQRQEPSPPERSVNTGHTQ